MQPQDIDLEEALLGTFLIDASRNVSDVIRNTNPIEFYLEKHRYVFEAIKKLHNLGLPHDILTVTDQLKKMGKLEEVGGPFIVATLSNRVASSANVEYHSLIFKQLYLQREIIRICSEKAALAYDSQYDIFDLIEELQVELNKLENLVNRRSRPVSSNEIGLQFEDLSHIPKIWTTGHKKFDQVIGMARDKIFLIAGGAKHGKSRFNMDLQFRLHEMHNDVATYWVTLEDTAQDLLNIYLSSKLYIKAKDIKYRKFDINTLPLIQDHIKRFNNFDILFVEQSAKIQQIGMDFNNFCRTRSDKLCVLVIDNILSLADRDDFKNSPNEMYDYIMSEILRIRQKTAGLVIPIHHYKDSQQYEAKIEAAFRPRLSDMKGTETFRRTPNQVSLLNNPGKYDDLVAEYPDMKDVFKRLFICDTGANREDVSDDDTALIRFWANLDVNIFEEIE